MPRSHLHDYFGFCHTCKEVPGTDMNRDAVQTFLAEVAGDTERANEAIEQSKAVLKTRGF